MSLSQLQGCFAERLLEKHLPPDAVYRGTDLSTTMIGLAKERLRRFGERSQIVFTDGSPQVSADPLSVHAFVATYVLDLLSAEDIHAVLAEARRVIRPGGRLCVVSLTNGRAGLSMVVSRLRSGIHWLRLALVGGCRPLSLPDFLGDREWHLHHVSVVVAYGIPSETVVASPT